MWGRTRLHCLIVCPTKLVIHLSIAVYGQLSVLWGTTGIMIHAVKVCYFYQVLLPALCPHILQKNTGKLSLKKIKSMFKSCRQGSFPSPSFSYIYTVYSIRSCSILEYQTAAKWDTVFLYKGRLLIYIAEVSRGSRKDCHLSKGTEEAWK